MANRLRIQLILKKLLTGCLVTLFCGFAGASAATDADNPNHYELLFSIDLTKATSKAEASITLRQTNQLLREARFKAPRDTYSDFSGDGEIERKGKYLHWRPPAKGGTLSYKVLITHERNKGGYDAAVTDDWAIFRGDDIFPPASIMQRTNVSASSKLQVKRKKNWSIETPYPEQTDGLFRINNPRRIFDRPTGWMITGRLGIRRDFINNIETSVAAPLNSGAERIAMLALLRWTLPILATELPEMPEKLSIVSAGEPMWRGGLSASNSLFVNADIRLISEDATSTLLHETMHVVAPVTTKRMHDWIDEGIAEYLTLDLLRRSGSISLERFSATLNRFKARGKHVDDMATAYASGNITARAVYIFFELDQELQSQSDGETDILDLVSVLMTSKTPVDLNELRKTCRDLTGAKSIAALSDKNVPGFKIR